MKLLKIIRDDGFVFNIGDESDDYELLSKSGTGNVEVEQFYDAKGYGYGDSLSGYRVKARTIKYKITSHIDISISRRFLSHYFNVLHSYTIQSFFNGREVWISGSLMTPKPNEDDYSHEEIEVSFYCEDPYWKSLIDTTRSFYTAADLWHYPYAFVEPSADLPANAYTVYERINLSNTAYIYNDGDAPADFTITINGEVVNPKITVNNAVITFNGTVKAGQQLFIDATNGIYTIDGVNVLSKIQISNELQLKVGDNTLMSSAPMFGTINYNKLYNGDM